VTIPRLFEPGRDLCPGSSFNPEKEVLHYLRRVLRLKPGDPVLVLDGGPSAWRAILAGEESGLALRIEKMEDSVRVVPDGRPICVLVPALKGDRHELAIQKATELGATDIRVYFADRSIPRPSARESVKLDRYRKVAEEACRQCDRASIPLVSLHSSLRSAIEVLPDGFMRFLLSEIGVVQPLVKLAAQPGPVVLAVGPEGSFTDEERAMLLAAGFVPAGLGPRVLKAETAAIAAVMAAQVSAGDMG